MNKPSKSRIRQSFERAAHTYDGAAEVQRRICDSMASHAFLAESPQKFNQILDAGCGTGYAQHLLQIRFPEAQFLALDISVAMLTQITLPCHQVAADLENLPLAQHSIDLYWSSLALQWCDLNQSLREAKRVLKPDGSLLISTLGPMTFHELDTAFTGVDRHRHTLEFHSPTEVAQCAQNAGFSSIQISRHSHTIYYPDFRALLLAVKAIGANLVGTGRRQGLMTASAFTKANLAYENQRTPAGLPLSYDIIQLSAKV